MPNNTSLCKENKKKKHTKSAAVKPTLGLCVLWGREGGKGDLSWSTCLLFPKKLQWYFGVKNGCSGAKQGWRGVVMGAAFLALVLAVQHPGGMWGVLPPGCGG